MSGSGMELESIAPDQAGFSPDIGEKLDAGIRAGLLRDLHSVVVVRHGRSVLERYFSGPDQAWGKPLGNVTFGPDSLHDLRSVTKSIVGLLYGIALERGSVPSPTAPLIALFPHCQPVDTEGRKADLTVADALRMTLGLEWNERVPYDQPANSEYAMERAPDRYRYILERPSASPAGARWIYCGGATALLAHLITEGTGKRLPEFAQEVLFDPLGISHYEWAVGADGIHSAASGLRLSARALSCIGTLVVSEGLWHGRQIVPRSWLEESFSRIVPTGDGLHYGWHWFIGSERVPAFVGDQRWAGSFGNGGQRLWIMPAAGVVLVVFSGAYNRSDAAVSPTRIWREIIIANLLK